MATIGDIGGRTQLQDLEARFAIEAPVINGSVDLISAKPECSKTRGSNVRQRFNMYMIYSNTEWYCSGKKSSYVLYVRRVISFTSVSMSPVWAGG
jgi:hypothetical protein